MEPVTLVLRRLIAIALLVAGLVLVLATPRSDAAPPEDCSKTTAQAAQGADSVFVGLVDRVQRVQGQAKRTTYVNTVQVEEVFKGPIEQESVPVVTAEGTRRTPGLGALEEGERYLFFVQAGTEALSAGGCSGTKAAAEQQVTRVEELLGEGRPAVPPEPPEASFDRVGDSDPASFTRSAAPGLALVLVGLLGLIVVRRVGRR